MKNIREEKGFTYGISSSLIPQKENGYLIIGTDVKKEFTQQTIDEIHKEIARLQTEQISENELEAKIAAMLTAYLLENKNTIPSDSNNNSSGSSSNKSRWKDRAK
jgi:predicted Zn-dependent peptidase